MDDIEAWGKYPQHRWIFNKLELALKLGHKAGPACVPVEKTGLYVIRPVYNLYGMGIGAKVINISTNDNQNIKENDLIPPGYFWCQFFNGNHYSIDYKRTDAPSGSVFAWEPFHCMQGFNKRNNLVKFERWVVCEIPEFANDVPRFLYGLDGVDFLNIEYKNNKIIEIHLRTGNDIAHNFDIGEGLWPVWKGSEYLKVKPNFIPNEDGDEYDASGHLEDVRIGYLKI